MRKLILSLTAMAALFVFPIAGFSQTVEIGPGGVRVDDGRARRSAARVFSSDTGHYQKRVSKTEGECS